MSDGVSGNPFQHVRMNWFLDATSMNLGGYIHNMMNDSRGQHSMRKGPLTQGAAWFIERGLFRGIRTFDELEARIRASPDSNPRGDKEKVKGDAWGDLC